MFVVSLTIKISAPATIPPEGSTTIPLIVPVGDCPEQIVAKVKPRMTRSVAVRTRKEPPLARNVSSLLGLCEPQAFLCQSRFCPANRTVIFKFDWTMDDSDLHAG